MHTNLEEPIEHISRNLRPDPTPEEIRERCLEIHSEWDDYTRRLRAGESGAKIRARTTWTVPLAHSEIYESRLAE